MTPQSIPTSSLLEQPVSEYPVDPVPEDSLTAVVEVIDTIYENVTPANAVFSKDELTVNSAGYLQTEESVAAEPWDTITSNVKSLDMTTGPTSAWESQVTPEKTPCLSVEANDKATKLAVEYRPTEGVFISFESRPTSHESEFLTFFRGTLSEWGAKPAIEHFEPVPQQLGEVVESDLGAYAFIYQFWPFMREILPADEYELMSNRAEDMLDRILSES